MMKKIYSILIAFAILFNVFLDFSSGNKTEADSGEHLVGCSVQTNPQYDNYANGTNFLNNHVTQYFRNLTSNFGNNVKGSCGYVALGMMLSYYDTFWDDTIIPEVYDKTSDLEENQITSQTQSPGIFYEPNSIVYNKMPNVEYVQAIRQYSGTYFHLKLIEIGMDQFNYFNSGDKDNPCGLSAGSLTNLSTYYLYTYRQFNSSQISISTCYDDNSVKQFSINKIKQGIPVLVLLHDDDGNGHFIVAYDYDETNNELYGHFGWDAADAHVKLSATNYTTYCTAMSFEFNLPHKCSNNYVYTTCAGETKHCSCELAIHPNHSHSYSGHNCVKCDAYTTAHDYTFNYVNNNQTQHTAYCTCGASKVENHSYTVRYQDTDSSTHTAFCACGASTSVSHLYGHRYKRKDGTSHYSYCICGRYTTGGHVVRGAAAGEKFSMCVLCKGLAEIGFVEMGLSEIMSNRIITANGSYILPNGIIVLSDADYQGYLNGTFVIPHSHDVAA